MVGRISAVPAILQVICETTGMGFAAVARVTESSWTACAVLDRLNFGLEPGGELDLTTTLCHEIRASHDPVIIDHVSQDALYRDHHTPRIYGFESYIAVPVFRTNGSFFGTICALDPKPAQLTGTPIETMMNSFARLLAVQIESEEALQQTQAELLEAREIAELREQFIAVLGHDLRNPLFAISASAELLLRRTRDESLTPVVQHILTAGKRASSLVDDVLDFARGRLGNGIPLNLDDDTDLEAALRHVIAEVQRVHPSRVINASICGLDGIRCDRARLAQLLSNLVANANAIAHGARDGSVEIRATIERGEFFLTVTNQGPAISAQVAAQLFRPYSRVITDMPQAGLGLGLYIAKQIAQAHGGELGVVSSDAEGTTFTFRLQLA